MRVDFCEDPDLEVIVRQTDRDHGTIFTNHSRPLELTRVAGQPQRIVLNIEKASMSSNTCSVGSYLPRVSKGRCVQVGQYFPFVWAEGAHTLLSNASVPRGVEVKDGACQER